MTFTGYETLLIERRGRVLEITLNRPKKLNAVDEKMHADLARVFVDVSNEPHSDIAMLTGAGRGLLVGRRYRVDAENDRRSGSVREDRTREGKQIVFSLPDCEKPVIVKVYERATGLGATFVDAKITSQHGAMVEIARVT